MKSCTESFICKTPIPPNMVVFDDKDVAFLKGFAVASCFYLIITITFICYVHGMFSYFCARCLHPASSDRHDHGPNDSDHHHHRYDDHHHHDVRQGEQQQQQHRRQAPSFSGGTYVRKVLQPTTQQPEQQQQLQLPQMYGVPDQQQQQPLINFATTTAMRRGGGGGGQPQHGWTSAPQSELVSRILRQPPSQPSTVGVGDRRGGVVRVPAKSLPKTPYNSPASHSTFNADATQRIVEEEDEEEVDVQQQVVPTTTTTTAEIEHVYANAAELADADEARLMDEAAAFRE